MQNDNNGQQQANADQGANAGTSVKDEVKSSVQDVSKAAGEKTAEIGDAMKNQVQNVGNEAGQQVKDLGKAGVNQIQNLGQAGASQVGSAVGKMFSSVTDQKAAQPPVSKEEKVYAAIAYIPFVSIISIIIKPDSAYVRLHSKQGLLLAILFFFVGMLAAIVSLFGVIGQFMAFLLGLVPLGCLIIGVYSMYLAFSGFWWKIPVLGGIADIIPVEMMAKVSKENITGQIGIAKTDYDNRADTLKQEKQEKGSSTANVSPAMPNDSLSASGNVTTSAGGTAPASGTTATNEAKNTEDSNKVS